MQKQEFLYRGPNHAANLNDMRLKDKYCDVTIKVDGKEIRAHKVVLAANLNYFETMFSSNSFKESQNGLITMKSVKKADLELFVSYAYTGEILLTDSNALNLLELANYLSEDGIKEACVEFLKNHLKAEEACRAYKFANTIECLSLKNAAKAKIVTNFGDYWESADYLTFEADTLMDIISDVKAQSIQLQQMLFEGIIRWIKHDAKHRKIRMEDLLSSINISKLKVGEVTSCLFRNLAHFNDEYGITKDALFYYEANKIESKGQGQVLMAMDDAGFAQFYSFTEKKWFLQLKIREAPTNFEFSTVMNDKLYYVSDSPEVESIVYIFDPHLKEITTLEHSPGSILENTSLCTCSRYLYICGGVRSDSMSNQILRYDPQINSFETLTPMTKNRRSAASIFYQGCLHVLGGFDGLSDLQSVEKYDSIRNEWTTLPSMCEKRRGHAVVELDGKLYACGGVNNNPSVEVYDPRTNGWKLVANMNRQRSYFLVVAHEGKLLAIGGAEDKTVEVYDPSKNQWQMDDEMSSELKVEFCAGGLFSYNSITNT